MRVHFSTYSPKTGSRMWPILVLHSVIKLGWGGGILGFATSCASRQVQPSLLNKAIKRKKKKKEGGRGGKRGEREGEKGKEGEIFIQCGHIGKHD